MAITQPLSGSEMPVTLAPGSLSPVREATVHHLHARTGQEAKLWLSPETVIYQAFLGSLNYEGDDPSEWERPIDPDNPTFLGGNIRGATAKLPYIVELGADALWVSPFNRGVGYHGYHTTDLKEVDPHFGTEADLQQLIDQSHAQGLKVISDFVPNHVSDQHPFFIEAKSSPDSPYRDWFIFDGSPEGYRKFLGFGCLAKLNLDHPPAMAHVLDAARKWLDMGLDGYRIDHAIGLSNQNIEDLIGTLRREYPGRAFIGEALLDGTDWSHLNTLRFPGKRSAMTLRRLGMEAAANSLLYRNYARGGRLDGLLNFSGTVLLEQYANSDGQREQGRLRREVVKQSQRYKGQILLPTALDDHDRERALFRYGNDTERLKRAAELQADLGQPMIIYYGTEAGMTQPMAFADRPIHADLLARQRMEWDRPNTNLLDFYARLIRGRKS